MVKFWYGAICASVIFVGAYFMFGGQMRANQMSSDMPGVEQPANPIDSLSRAPNSEGDHEAALNKFIYSIKTKEDVDKAITGINEYAKNNPTSTAAQIYKNFVTPVRLFKGMAWRLRFLVEPVDAAYIASISYLRAFKRNSDRRAPHIDALFAYVTEPNPGENIQGQTGLFKTAAELQDFMATKVAAEVKKQNEAYKAILTKHGSNDAPLFSFDAGLILGEDEVKNSASQTMRWRKFMPGHLKGLMANMYERMGFGLYIASYDLEALQYFMNTLTARSLVAKKGTVDAKTKVGNLVTTVFDVHLQSPKEVSELLYSMSKAAPTDKKSKFLTLRPSAKTGKYLSEALASIRNAVNYRIEAHKDMETLATKGNQKEYFANADFLTSRPAITLAALEKRRKLLYSNGPTDFKDRVDNSSFDVNISAMFNPNNPYVNDLKKLYPAPNHFNAALKETDGGPRESFKWNYDYGTPQAWPDVTFAGVLPNTNSPADYKKKLVSISRDASTPALTYWLRLFM